MKKQPLTTKVKQILSVAFLILSVLFFILLIVFKPNLTKVASNMVKTQAGSEIQKKESAFIDSAYNYSKNKLSYEITFLEFGAKGCSACKRMEIVMSEISAKYPNRINVVFINVMLPKNHNLMKYYGIASIPTQVFLNKEATEFFRHTGYYSTQELIKSLTLN